MCSRREKVEEKSASWEELRKQQAHFGTPENVHPHECLSSSC